MLGGPQKHPFAAFWVVDGVEQANELLSGKLFGVEANAGELANEMISFGLEIAERFLNELGFVFGGGFGLVRFFLERVGWG